MSSRVCRFKVSNIGLEVSVEDFREALIDQLALDDVHLDGASFKTSDAGDSKEAEISLSNEEAEVLRGPMRNAKVFLGRTMLLQFDEIGGPRKVVQNRAVPKPATAKVAAKPSPDSASSINSSRPRPKSGLSAWERDDDVDAEQQRIEAAAVEQEQRRLVEQQADFPRFRGLASDPDVVPTGHGTTGHVPPPSRLPQRSRDLTRGSAKPSNGPISGTEDVPLGDYLPFSRSLADKISRGDTGIGKVVLQFLNDQFHTYSDEVVKSNFRPFEYKQGGSWRRFIVDISVQKINNGFRVSYSTSGGGGDDEAPKGADALDTSDEESPGFKSRKENDARSRRVEQLRQRMREDPPSPRGSIERGNKPPAWRPLDLEPRGERHSMGPEMANCTRWLSPAPEGGDPLAGPGKPGESKSYRACAGVENPCVIQ